MNSRSTGPHHTDYPAPAGIYRRIRVERLGIQMLVDHPDGQTALRLENNVCLLSILPDRYKAFKNDLQVL